MIECIRTEYFEDESFFFLGRTKISSIFATVFRRSSNNAEVAQLVEHNLAPEDKRSQPWQDECKNRQTAKAKENNAEVAQLVEHNLAKVGVAGSNPVFRSRKKSLARMVELVDTRDLKSLGQ